ncbi:MAG: class I SAM-dependent methyltransferase [Bryobacteraceae bacterium]|jgi:ubiquinone/menaquinone biosynthesis C-methylase UbiE
MSDPSVGERMRKDWNRRAREDANYYVAFGRRKQDETEFLATGAYIVEKMEDELKRLPAGANRRSWRALEIGCGPGRLMKPLSRNFGEIHGVDVADEMIALARERLAGTPHAHVHVTSGASLPQFADDSFDFVYSYAVFQHIPDHSVVLDYMRETRRVLKPGGVFRGQFNGLPCNAGDKYDTWAGCRFTAAEIRQFTRGNGFDLLELSGMDTQYLWTTWRKRVPGNEPTPAAGSASVRRITNAVGTEPAVTTTGRFSAISLWVVGLPPRCELNGIVAFVGGREATAFYVGSPIYDGLRPQLSLALPQGTPTGLQPIRILWNGGELLRATVRVIPPGPPLPRVISVTDGVNILSAGQVSSGLVKVVTEEMADPAMFFATVSGRAVQKLEWFLTDPLPPRCEFNFALPPGMARGAHALEIRYGRRLFVFPITVV